jgi:hypothetical protein
LVSQDPHRTGSAPASVPVSLSLQSLLLQLLVLWLVSDTFPLHGSYRLGVAHAFVSPKSLALDVPFSVSSSSCSLTSPLGITVPPKDPCPFYRNHHRPRTRVGLVPETANVATDLADYAPLATSLFNNMKLPAAVVTAGMISLGFATGFPELPRESPINQRVYPPELRARCESLKRLHIVVALIAVTSELITVMWAAVEVNQLTEKKFELTASVWDLIQMDCDLAWSAVNSHFVLGIIGFVTMLALRAYVMLLAAEASAALMTAASSGTAAALCLMISIVNRGVESGGGGNQRYGNSIFDLFKHYAVLLFQAATNEVSPGPLQLSAIVLEIISLVFMANVLLFQNGKMEPYNEECDEEDEECSVIDIMDAVASSSMSSINGDTNDTNKVNGGGGFEEPYFATIRRAGERTTARCLEFEEEKKSNQQERRREAKRKFDEEEEWDSGDSSVSIY